MGVPRAEWMRLAVSALLSCDWVSTSILCVCVCRPPSLWPAPAARGSWVQSSRTPPLCLAVLAVVVGEPQPLPPAAYLTQGRRSVPKSGALGRLQVPGASVHPVHAGSRPGAEDARRSGSGSKVRGQGRARVGPGMLLWGFCRLLGTSQADDCTRPLHTPAWTPASGRAVGWGEGMLGSEKDGGLKASCSGQLGVVPPLPRTRTLSVQNGILGPGHVLAFPGAAGWGVTGIWHEEASARSSLPPGSGPERRVPGWE